MRTTAILVLGLTMMATSVGCAAAADPEPEELAESNLSASGDPLNGKTFFSDGSDDVACGKSLTLSGTSFSYRECKDGGVIYTRGSWEISSALGTLNLNASDGSSSRWDISVDGSGRVTLKRWWALFETLYSE